ncbi:MAG: PHP domain-containing protein [Cyanobacteria bacterium P01_C01_bin.89]
MRDVFRTVDIKTCPTRYNFHLHTIYSDGKLTPEDVVQQALEIGLKGLAITDHNAVGGYFAAAEWLARHSGEFYRPEGDRLKLWTGIEINAHLLEGEVHILGYAFDPDSAAMAPYIKGKKATGDDFLASQVVASIQAAGGLAVLAHPVRYRQPPELLIPAAEMLGFDGIEVYYAYDRPDVWRPSPDQLERVLTLCEGRDLLHTCGTDTHGLSILRRTGC